jgi:hypothetical protein
LTLNYEQDLPQVLSTELIAQLLQIFSIAKNNSMKCGYDSLGAGCLINHLHFELLMLDDIQGMDRLPIENKEDFPFIATQLRHKDVEEISTVKN